MDCLISILEFFGVLILLFGLGILVGHLLKLDKYVEDQQNERKLNL
jgi:hypothetical protein